MRTGRIARNGSWARWPFLALLGLTTGLLSAQDPPRNYNERSIDKTATPQDRQGIWVLDFHFKDPRAITIDLPGRGRKVIWYLVYEVSNSTGEARVFIPDFVWVCHDQDTTHHDELLPTAQRVIQRLEDPTGVIQFKNSVTIANEPIPNSKEFDEKGQRIAYAKRVAGVATWSDVNPKCTQFSIYVYGLSDGWAQVDGPDGKPIIRRKALQLKFRRLGDEFNQNSGQIRYLGHDWVYATSELPTPSLDEAKPAAPAAPTGAGKKETPKKP